MIINKNEILKNHCFTELVYGRINKKLSANLSKVEAELLIKNVLEITEIDQFQKKGKNFYISNQQFNLKITINSNTFRVITVDKLKK